MLSPRDTSGACPADNQSAMYDASPPQSERGSELLLEHCAVSQEELSVRTPAFVRLEEELGCELTRLLVEALARRRAARVGV